MIKGSNETNCGTTLIYKDETDIILEKCFLMKQINKIFIY